MVIQKTASFSDDDLKIVPRTVQSETVDKLRYAILTGRFKPGARLAEAMLCNLLNVSRTSIRESLRRLEGEKLIVIVPNKGPSVARITWAEAAGIYEVRALLEGEATARFAQVVKPDQIKTMRSAIRSFARAVADNDALGRISTTNEFYDVILGGCENPVIADILQGLRARINFLRFQSMGRPGRTKHSVAELKAILRAIERGDPAAARKAAIKHVTSASVAAR
jgi:DNA-binding GntR family transcriptional regulator